MDSTGRDSPLGGPARDTAVDQDATIVRGSLDPSTDVPVALEQKSLRLRYEERSYLGEGGMGEVRVYRDRAIGREIAIKTLRGRSETSPGDEARFIREARVQGQLEHPGIVPVYDMGRDADGAAYFAMKRVRGLSLQEIIDGLRAADPAMTERYSRRRLLMAFASACLAVAFAHTRGVLHRDLKPSNIMLGDFGEVYVLDWGLAKVRGSVQTRLTLPGTVAGSAPTMVDAASEPEAQTIAGVAMGTPGYMAPEQVTCDEIDERADVYALGLVLFELLALVPLHQGTTVSELLAATLKAANARPSARAPGADVPPELDAICVKATALDRRDRYESARQFHDAVEGYLDGDRDVARRRELARGHARAAAEAARRAREPGSASTEERSRAMSEVGRALALDASNAQAMGTLMRLLAGPPKDLPPEVAAELAAGARQTEAVLGRGPVLGGIVALSVMPLFLWLGIRSWPALGVLVALWIAFGMIGRAVKGKLTAVLLVTGLAATAWSALIAGPFIIVPAAATTFTTYATMTPGQSRRPVILMVANLMVLIPWALMHWHVLPGAVRGVGDALVIQSVIVDLPPLRSDIVLLVIYSALMFLCSALATAFRRRLDDAERRLVVQSWQLRQLIPEGLRVITRAGGNA